MANKIKLRRSYTSGAVPLSSDLDTNECCVNWADNKLFVKNSAGNIVSVTLGGGGSSSIVEATTAAGFPATGASQTLYISKDSSRVYRWDSSGGVYVESGPIGGGFAFAGVPASSTATGSTGQIAADGSFWYYCSAPNTWVRTALSTWSAFTPASVAGLQAWYDASDASTLYDATSGGSLVAADGVVARWEDKSGNTRHATQATSGSRPLRKSNVQGGRGVLRFDGTNDWLSVASSASSLKFLHTSNSTVFIVAKPGTTSDPNTVMFLIDSNGRSTTSIGYHAMYEDRSSVANDMIDVLITNGQNATYVERAATLSNNFVANTFSVMSIVSTPSASASSRLSMRRNGGTAFGGNSSSGTASSADASYDLTIGASSISRDDNWNGDIAEIVVYNTALSDTDRSAVEQYLISKYGVT